MSANSAVTVLRSPSSVGGIGLLRRYDADCRDSFIVDENLGFAVPVSP